MKSISSKKIEYVYCVYCGTVFVSFPMDLSRFCNEDVHIHTCPVCNKSSDAYEVDTLFKKIK